MKNFRIIFLLLIALSSTAQKGKEYNYTVDLTNVMDDHLQVELTVPLISTKEVVFNLPKIVPGTYSIEDYGRFVSELKALDKSGHELPIEKLNENSWKIKDANKLKKITYLIEDSFDTSLAGPDIFQPAGTNFEDGKNFLINTGGFFGYLEGHKDQPYKFNIIRDKEFYGSTGLIAIRSNEPLSTIKLEKGNPDPDKRVDVYQVEDFDRLIDSPLMYCKPDTAIVRVANAEVLISSYSPNQKINAKEIAASVRDILKAQAKFLGGKLPVDKYAFIFYFTDQPVTSYGALEHSYSSVYYMPESTIQETDAQLRDFAAHEFFHIVTPLTIHSEEIHRFNFNDPKMSRHLWMYEGVTEYFAGLVQVKYGLISKEEYLQRLQGKTQVAARFLDDVPFTDISQYTLERYQDQYYNVYFKGAFIGLCLDIKLRSLSGGKYGVQNLMADLSKKFGKVQAFKDEELFTEIEKLTYPEIGEFFRRYVAGPETLPFKEVFGLVGINYQKETYAMELSLGIENAAIKVEHIDGKPFLAIGDAAALNEQGKLLGLQNNDILIKINGEKIPDLGPESQRFFTQKKEALAEGQPLSMTVLRKSGDKAEEVELKSTIKKVERKKGSAITIDPNATPEQVKLREAWWTAQ